MVITIDDKDYELIDFGAKITNKRIEMRGYSFARNYLAVAGSDKEYRIYNTISGEPIIRCRFLQRSTAFKLAKILEKRYLDWFEIWDSYPLANIFSLCKYTVDDGATIFEMLELLDKMETVSDQELYDKYQEAKEIGRKWRT